MKKLGITLLLLMIIAIVSVVVSNSVGIGYGIFIACASLIWLFYILILCKKRKTIGKITPNGLFGSRMVNIWLSSVVVVYAFSTYRSLVVNVLLTIISFFVFWIFRNIREEYRKKNVLNGRFIAIIYLYKFCMVNVLSIVVTVYNVVFEKGEWLSENPHTSLLAKLICIIVSVTLDAITLYPKSPFLVFCSNNYANDYYTKDDEEGNTQI